MKPAKVFAARGNSNSTELTKEYAKKWLFLINCLLERELQDNCILCQSEITSRDEVCFRAIRDGHKFISCMTGGLIKHGMPPSLYKINYHYLYLLSNYYFKLDFGHP